MELSNKGYQNLVARISTRYEQGQSNAVQAVNRSMVETYCLSNLKRMRQFFLVFPIGATVSHQLGWSMYVELLKIDVPHERSFYQQQSILEKWNVRELKR